MLAWSQHPITKTQLEIDEYNASTRREWREKRFDVYKNRVSNILLCECYINRLFEVGYITFDEYRDIALLPYRGTLYPSTYNKTNFESHRLLFLCSEQELYPLILRQIVRYLAYLFIEAGYRRELLLDVVHFADKEDRSEIYKMAKEGCKLRDIIDKYKLQAIYEKNANKAEAYYHCLLTKKTAQQI